MRGEVGMETPKKEMDFSDVTHDTFHFPCKTGFQGYKEIKRMKFYAKLKFFRETRM